MSPWVFLLLSLVALAIAMALQSAVERIGRRRPDLRTACNVGTLAIVLMFLGTIAIVASRADAARPTPGKRCARFCADDGGIVQSWGPDDACTCSPATGGR